jgi:PAS domain S-box-containing protein
MDMSMAMIYLVDRDTLSYLDVNDTACKTLDLSREQLLALGPGKTLGFTDTELIERYDRLIAEGGSSRIERRIKRPQGEDSIVEVFSSATCIDERWLIIGVARDVSARKQAERRSLHCSGAYCLVSTATD